MSIFRRKSVTLDVSRLPWRRGRSLEALMTGQEVALVGGGHELGVLEFRATALERVVMERTLRR